MDISSPFVGDALVHLFRGVPAEVTKTLITRTRLVDFASGASNIETVSAVAKDGVRVLGFNKLHAKLYVFDERYALVTSANATYSGFYRNAECGLAVDDADVARNLSIQIRSGFGVSPPPSIWSEQELLSLVPAIERLRKRIPKATKIRIREGEEDDDLELSRADARVLLSSTAKWTQLVFRNLVKVPAAKFTTQEIADACQNDIVREFPENRHPREKIRQQLQVLRDLGFLQFSGRGRYQLSVKFTH